MVKIRVFIPHMEMQGIFEDVLTKLPKYKNIEFETTYVFGTPVELSKNKDADVLVARGMTYDTLRHLFPEKYTVQIQLDSFDIFAALIECRSLQVKKIGLCIHNLEFPWQQELQELCGAPILLCDVTDEQSAEDAVEKALREGADVIVGAGTVCGICDRIGVRRIHIHTKYSAVEAAIKEALDAALMINRERSRSNIINTMMHHCEEGIIAINKDGNVLEINNQAYRLLQLTTVGNWHGKPANQLVHKTEWKKFLENNGETEQLFRFQERNLFVQYRPLEVGEEHEAGALIFIRNASYIIEEEGKIRKELAAKGLAVKYSFRNILGHSDAIRRNIQMAERYSKVNSNVLIIGETGTGKELFAHSIHGASRRSNQPFVALNCAALPESLLESELFGYEAGAFSGAARGGKIGLFELAHRGTIFLDEIGEIPISLQAKLLRVLQEKEIRRIGSDSVHPIDVRVISATNVNIEEKIKEGKFRSDLYYRLNILDISIPSLRERREDIQELMDAFLASFACEMGKSIPTVTPTAAKLLKEYDWRGNVRELRNVCERLTVLNDTDEIDEELLQQLKVFKKYSVKEENSARPEADIYSHLTPKKKKKELAEELGVSRTTLWRMAKKQSELEKKQREQETR